MALEPIFVLGICLGLSAFSMGSGQGFGVEGLELLVMHHFLNLGLEWPISLKKPPKHGRPEKKFG